MKLQRFLLRNKAKVGDDLVVADPALSNQLSKVFRMGAGDKVMLFDGDGFEYVSTVASLRKDGAVFHVEESSPSDRPPERKNSLRPALIKKDKLEWVLQKATELGAASFHPIIAERSEKLGFDLKRAGKIIKEAAEQSGWGRMPEIFEPISLEEAILNADNPIILEGGRGQVFKRECLSEASFRAKKPAYSDAPISVFIGPEGGWTNEEKEYFSARKFRPFHWANRL